MTSNVAERTGSAWPAGPVAPDAAPVAARASSPGNAAADGAIPAAGDARSTGDAPAADVALAAGPVPVAGGSPAPGATPAPDDVFAPHGASALGGALPPGNAPAPAIAHASKPPSRAGAYVVGACTVLLVALTMLGGVLNVGDHLSAAHPALGWVFYGLIAALVAVGIVVPLVKIAQRPIFSLYQLHDEQGHAKRRRCRMLADNLIANTQLADGEIAELERCLQAGDKADDLLIDFFNRHCVPQIDVATKQAATTAFFVSAIAHSPLINVVTMLSICLDLVRTIVERCGFRPTNLALARLYARVMLSALVIGGIEDSDLSDLLGQLMGGGTGARVGGIVLSSTAEGVVSAFLVFRVGVITKRWLTAVDGPERMSSIRRTSYREALSLMRTSGFMQTVTETMKQTAGTVASSAANSVADAAKSTVEQAKSQAKSVADSAKSRFSFWRRGDSRASR